MPEIHIARVKFAKPYDDRANYGAAVYATIMDTTFGPMLDYVMVSHEEDGDVETTMVVPGFALSPVSYDRVCKAIGIAP
jgi:hypothetical protein